jgi:hypothetical protein
MRPEYWLFTIPLRLPSVRTKPGQGKLAKRRSPSTRPCTPTTAPIASHIAARSFHACLCSKPRRAELH